MKKAIFPSIITLSALSVSVSAAFYSISGLSKLFAGASLEVIIMASSLEVAKLVIASLLYRHWGTLNKILRGYLVMAATVLILITSMGIYGFLSAAYQDTYRQLTIKENQTKFLTQKKDFYEKDVIRYDAELERISSNISTLSNAKSSSIQIKDTSVVGGLRTTISTAELRLAQKRIGVEEENRKAIQAKREVVADSLQKYQLKILELDNNTEVAGELGPLQYLSGLTNTPMDRIINILLLVIIFVFDPLAIALVIAANFAFEKAYPKKKYNENLYGEKVEEQVEDMRKVVDKYDDLQDEIDVWDSTLLDGLEDEELDKDYTVEEVTNEDGNVDESEIDTNDLKNIEVKDVEVVEPKDVVKDDEELKPIKILQKGPSSHRVLYSNGEIKKVKKNDLTIKYL